LSLDIRRLGFYRRGLLRVWTNGSVTSGKARLRFMVDSWQATEDRSPGNDLLHQNSILNEWFERGGYLCLKFFLPSGYDFRRRIGPRERTPD
jgi:hypothetical protein